MIGKVIELLHSDEWHGVSENVEIAKGKHERVTTWKGFWTTLKRMRNVRKANS